MLEVPLSAFAAAHSDGAIVVDVREPGEYVTGHVPGATLVPMGQVVSRMSELPKDMPIYLILRQRKPQPLDGQLPDPRGL